MTTVKRNSGESASTIEPSDKFEYCECCLSIPNEHLDLRQLIDVLRLFEILCCFRAISPNGRLKGGWHTEYRTFLAKRNSNTAESQNLMSLSGARSHIFEAWIKCKFNEVPIFPVKDIRQGSYEFVLSLVNLAAIFGLQDYSLLKDMIQWSTSTLKTLFDFTPELDSPYKTKQNKDITSVLIQSGDGMLMLSKDLIKAANNFDDVEFSETISKNTRTWSVKMKRLQSGHRIVSDT